MKGDCIFQEVEHLYRKRKLEDIISLSNLERYTKNKDSLKILNNLPLQDGDADGERFIRVEGEASDFGVFFLQETEAREDIARFRCCVAEAHSRCVDPAKASEISELCSEMDDPISFWHESIDRGGRFSGRKLTKKLGKLEIPSPTGYLAAVKAASELAKGKTTLYICASVRSFLQLGHNKDVDDHSCYRAGHECQGAPPTLTASPNTVTFYLTDEDGKVIARAWGVLNDGAVYYQNVYPNSTSVNRLLCRAAIAGVANYLGYDHCTSSAYIVRPDIVYGNSDCVALVKLGSLNGHNPENCRLSTDPEWPVVLDQDDFDEGCVTDIDGNRIPEDDAIYVESVDGFVHRYDDELFFCHYTDEYYYDTNNAVFAEDFGETIHNDYAVELYNGECVSQDANTGERFDGECVWLDEPSSDWVMLTAGPSEGTYADAYHTHTDEDDDVWLNTEWDEEVESRERQESETAA